MVFVKVKGGDDGFSEPIAVSSLTAVRGELMAFDRSNEVLIAASATTTPEDVVGISVAAVVSTETSMQIQEIEKNDTFIADTTNNSNASHNTHRMLLTDSKTVNNTASDDTTDAAVVVQIAPVGAASNKKILCRFVTVQDRAA